MADKLTLKRGDRICITLRGLTYIGIVRTAANYGSDPAHPDWYIEFEEDERGYMYWKQALDGGNVIKL